MSSIFIAFCFINSITGSEKYLSGTALYRTHENENHFDEIIFKGYLGPESLVSSFDLGSIVLFVGRYVLEDNTQYVSLIQAIDPDSASDTEFTKDDVPYGSPILIYSAPVVPNSHFSEGERESFMLSKRLFNGINNHRNIESKVIVSYNNLYNQYDAIKNCMKKTVFTVVGKLKLSTTKKIHLMAAEIEWSYVNTDSSSSNSSQEKKQELDQELQSIEAKYENFNKKSGAGNKKRKISQASTSSSTSASASSSKPSENDKAQSVNLQETIAQVKGKNKELADTSSD